MNEGFLTKKDLKDFANNSAGLISKAVNGMVKKGYTDAQIGSRLEDLAGEVQASITQQKAAGQWLTETQ
ncbi:Uncharacterised protein [Shigella sonnei]|nr:Uncharacterised protein [Shigella sonnei]